MSARQASSNGKTKWAFPTFDCEGCEQRKQIMGAGNWKIDALIFAAILIAIAVMWKVKIA